MTLSFLNTLVSETNVHQNAYLRDEDTSEDENHDEGEDKNPMFFPPGNNDEWNDDGLGEGNSEY